MNNLLKKLFVLIAASSAALASAQIHDPTFNAQGELERTVGLGITQLLGNTVPKDIPFKDESGNNVTFGDYLGKKPVIVALVYYRCPGMCALEFGGLVDSFTKLSQKSPIQTLIGKDVDIVCVSIDPNETPQDASDKKKTILSVVDYPGASDNWHFLTGSYDSINRLATAVGFNYVYNKRDKSINHPSGIMILSPDGKISSYMYGTGYPERPLYTDIQLAKDDKVGQKAEEFLLGCLCRDALTGKYTLQLWRILQLACGASVLIFAGALVTNGIKNRKLEDEAVKNAIEHPHDDSFPRNPKA